ncbi:hypothetical protein RRG08_040028 [Elysia crispata]|uniref:IgGFc-binding protein N-terminal domain-containing protein n=1 Tax=Elysia crispata TaxID=231223 RepID=A0AAE1DBK3_9GAST|nr:hypothetical protein RRG08_040028 [Elysia crispata]
MRMLRVLTLAVLLLCKPSYSSRSNAGTEFIIGFMNNDTPTKVGLEIFVTTMANTAQVTVSTPLYSNWQESFALARQTVKLVVLDYRLRVAYVAADNKAVRVLSDEPVTVYCVNKEQYTTDAYVAMPVHVVGKEYYSIHYIANAQILLVGITDGTSGICKMSDNSRSGSMKSVSNVNFLSGNTRYYNGYYNGDTMPWAVDRYQTFFITQYDDRSPDFTGSYLVSNKPVTCISGNYRAWIPKGMGSSDHLTEQLPSVDTWGKEFITMSTPDRGSGDLFRVLASEDNTDVKFGNGQITFNLQKAGDFHEMDIASNNVMTVVATKPVLIAMFSKSWSNDGPNYGDPAMSLLTPIVQYASEYTWSTTNLPNGNPFNDKISVIIKKDKKSDLILDGSVFGGTWISVTGSTEWQQSFAYVQPGSHNLYHLDPSVTFLAMATGTERYNSYAFSAGTRLAQINAPCSPTSPVAGDTVDNDCDGRVDEEALDNVDNDGDGQVDEDLALPPRVDGNWGSWGGYGACSVTCGGVCTKTRTRACDNPAPQNNGLTCPGSGSESQSCDMSGTPCPIDGGQTQWTSWTGCSVTCGVGTQPRSRSCKNPSPARAKEPPATPRAVTPEYPAQITSERRVGLLG